MQVVQIDGRDYALILTPLPRPGAVNFKVGVVEDNDKKNIKNVLLDTEIVLPDGEVAMLGFRDSQGEQLFHRLLRARPAMRTSAKEAVRLASMDKPRRSRTSSRSIPPRPWRRGSRASWCWKP